jgi:hypothetical protein
MKKNDVTCSCGASFRRLELWSETGDRGTYSCPVCDTPLEVIDGTKLIAYRLTVRPSPRTLLGYRRSENSNL